VWVSVAVAQVQTLQLSCFEARGIFLDQGLNPPMFPALAGGFSSKLIFNFSWEYILTQLPNSKGHCLRLAEVEGMAQRW